MSDRARKKEKHRLKRQRKQRDVRQRGAITPLQHLARSAGTYECFINDSDDSGIANLIVFGRARDGRHALGIFLVDFWCVGLKDVGGTAQLTREAFDRMIERWNS